MTAPVRSKDMRGHALRTELSFRPPISGEWRDADLSGCDGAIFSFRIRVTEHCLDSLHTTLNCLSRHRAGNILDDDRGPRSADFSREAPRQKSNQRSRVFGRIAWKGQELHASQCRVSRYLAPSNSVGVRHSDKYYRSTASSLCIERTSLALKTCCRTVRVEAEPTSKL